MASSLSLPTRPAGVVDDDAAYGAWLGDALENVPQLATPELAIREYAVMAKDPTLSTVLSSYVLQITNGHWAIDPAGCSADVAQLVADDLGLPVVGKDKPGAARVRGVSWHEHLEAALLALTYGHYGFELQAETVDGNARLVGLWDRAPWTVGEIHVDPKTGQFQGITQNVGGTRMPQNGRPQITADRMAWYTHGKVGANQAGVSLLRPGFGVHMVKREVLRITATAHRRFSMGVPTVVWAPGGTPTPEQIAAAQRAASAARAGETAGMSLPPGATLELVGLSGGVPNNLELLKWLDTQMSRFAMMPHIELGQNSAGGSRALGEAFIDSWTLALRAIGNGIASQATRQIAARIVEWNKGDQEPVPRITVTGIGENYQATVEAIAKLLDSKALSADPALEAYLRTKYGLPERDPSTAVQSPGADLPKPTTDTPATDHANSASAHDSKHDVAASAVRRRPPAQPSLFDGDPVLAAADTASRIQQQWDSAKARLLKRWPKLAAPLVAELADQAQAAVQAGDLAQLGQLEASAGVIAALAVPIRKAGTELAVQAAAGVVEEAAAQQVTISTPDAPGRERVQQHADAVVRIIASGYASGAAKTALQLSGASPPEVRAEVERQLGELGQSANGMVGTEIGGLLSAAQHAGRLAVMEQHPVRSVTAIEVNDANRCVVCAEASGRSYPTLAAALKDYPTSGNRSCLGRGRCRGYLLPHW